MWVSTGSDGRRGQGASDFSHAFSTHDDYPLDDEPAPAAQQPPPAFIPDDGASPEPSRYLSPAGAIAHVSSRDPDPSADPRRQLVHIPRHLAFGASGQSPSEYSFQQPRLDITEELDDEGDDTDSEHEDMRESGGDGTALLGLVMGGGRKKHSSSGDDAEDWRKLNVDAEGRARRARGARATAKTPLLAQQPSYPIQQADTLVTPTAALLLGAHESYQHFTPQTRRTFLRQQLDGTKLAQARARRDECCFGLCSWRPSFFGGRGSRLPHPCTFRRVLLLSLLVLIALCSGSELVLRKVVTGHMYNYRWFLWEVTTIITFVFTLLAAFMHRKAVRHFLQLHHVPIKFFVLSSMLDATSSLSLMIAVGVLPGLWGVLLPQLLIPMALLFRFFVTDGERVGRWGLVGGFAVVVGAFGSTLPHLLDYRPCNGNKSSRGELRAELLTNVLLLVVGLVPAAASAIYKQSFLQQHSMNTHVLNVALSGLQVLWGLMLAPFALEAQFLFNSGVEQKGRARIIEAEVEAAIRAAGGGGIGGAAGGHTDPDSLNWTDDVSRNMFVHFKEGFSCLAGINSEPGDACESLYPTLLIQASLLLVSMYGTQLLVQYVMSRSSREHWLAAALSAGTLVALVLLDLPSVHVLLPSWELGDCLPPIDALTGVAIAAVILGAVIAQWEPSQQPMDLDVWARLEEIRTVEELEQAKRAKKYPRTHANHASSSYK